MRPPLRIAVLECDTPLDGTRSKYGGYGGVFEAFLKSGASSLAREQKTATPVELEITKWDVVNSEQYPRLEDVDAVLLTGSRHNSFDNAPWILKLVAFTKEILETQARVRVIGVCFGHQIVGRAMGCRVGRSEGGWETSVTPLSLTETGVEVFGEGVDMALHQMHRDIVHGLPPGTTQLARSPRCENQGMYARNRVVTVQGHPEFTEEIVKELLVARHASGVFDDDMYADGMARVGLEHGGVAVGRAFVRFVAE